MVNSIALSFFNLGQSTTAGIGADLLAAWALARTQSAASVKPSTADPNAPYAPWEVGYPMPEDEALAKAALDGAAFFDLSAARYVDPSVEGDYARLFALHSGLKTLSALTTMLQDEKLNSVQRARIEQTFARGQAELEQFFAAQKFEEVRVALGDRVDAATTKLGVPIVSEDYTTAQIHRGRLTGTISGLDPDARFDIVAKSLGGTTQHVTIDLAQMGSLPRSLGGIVSFINGRLSAAGVQTRIEAVNQAPKTTEITIGGQTITRPYTGPGLYALKIDVRGGETIAFEAPDTNPALYVVGQTGSGGRLIKLEDVMGSPGEPSLLTRPAATQNPVGAAPGYIGAGAPYVAAPAEAWEKRSFLLADENGDTNTEAALAAAGEAQLTLRFADGRTLSVTTAWRAEGEETWRVRAGEHEDVGRLDDLAERLTQVLHEQGVAAGIDVWADGSGGAGLSLFTNDSVRIDNLTISGRTIALEDGAAPAGGVDGGLRASVFARRFETGPTIAAGALFTEMQTFTLTTDAVTSLISIDADEEGLSAEDLAAQLNEKLAERGIAARAAFVESGGSLVLQLDALHNVTGLTAKLNDTSYAGALAAPGAWASGGLPAANAGDPYGDARRTYAADSIEPLSLPGNEGALDIAITVETATGDRVVSLSISAAERANDPDISPGQWSAALQARLDAALNEAGVYVASNSLSSFTIAEGASQRLKSVVVNGQTIDYTPAAPASTGGAFDSVRSFSSATLAAVTNDEIAALVSDPTVSVTLKTVWGDRTISANLEPGDPRTLESAALRLNEALASAGYDLGVEAANLSGGAGLRILTGSSFTVSQVNALSIGGATAVTLDPIDAASHADDPMGAASVAARAARGAAALLTVPASSTFAAPSINSTGWFAGRAFDVSLGDGAKVLAARDTAIGPDGAIYVLADIANLAGDQSVKGERDVALLKYDSAGNLTFTRTLGAADEAQGFALAVAADGRVAVAGSVTGGLNGVGAEGGGADSFVTMYDAAGAELWSARRGAKGDDEVSALAFANDGTLIVAGRTKTALGAQIANGGWDSYVRGYSATGAELFTKQFGTSGDDGATALALRNAGGAIEITAGGVEDARGVLRQFTYSAAAGLSAGATRDLGAFRNGAKIASLAIDGAAIYVGGAVEADKLIIGATARAALAGLDGFVARVSTDLGSTALDRTTYLGSTKEDGVSEVTVVGGIVYAAGSAAGIIAGAARKGATDGFLARLDGAGDIAWLRDFNTTGGTLNVTGLAVDQSGASVLDILSLPRAKLQTADSTKLIDMSSLRVGDEFNIAVNGAAPRRIIVTATDTLTSLAVRIDQALGAAGDAHVERDGEVQRIAIDARRGDAVALMTGRDGRDALGGLGLQAGIVSIKPTEDNPARKGEIRSFGLGIQDGDLKLGGAAALKRTKAEISAALSILRQAYTALADPAELDKTAEERAREDRMNGPAPEYLQTQLANYQAALARLGG